MSNPGQERNNIFEDRVGIKRVSELAHMGIGIKQCSPENTENMLFVDPEEKKKECLR